MVQNLKGIFPVLYTPFDDNLKIDEEDLKKQIGYAIEQGAHGIVANATDSESFKMTCEERKKVTELVFEETKGRVPVIVGVSAAATVDSVELAFHASKKGAVAVFSLPPLISEVTPEDIFSHFKAIDEVVDVPVMLQERIVFFPISIIERFLKELKHVRFVKEERPLNAGQRISEIIHISDELRVFSGGENIMNELYRGAIGAIPSCVALRGYVKIYNSYTQGNIDDAWQEYERILPLLTFRKQVNSILLTKEILRRKGIFKTANAREPIGNGLDAMDLKLLDKLMSRAGNSI